MITIIIKFPIKNRWFVLKKVLCSLSALDFCQMVFKLRLLQHELLNYVIHSKNENLLFDRIILYILIKRSMSFHVA